jgi:hypothetical protein
METLPAGHYPLSAGEGGACMINGEAGTLVREGEYLVCRAKPPIGPTRATPTNRGADSVTGDRTLQDQAWREMVERQQQAWKTPA